jgi:hypothetical protein
MGGRQHQSGNVSGVPMAEYPTLDDLLWLFEVEPVLVDPDLGWPISEATWSTTRGSWTVTITIGVYDRTVEIHGALGGVSTIHVKLNGIVERLSVDRTHGQEALVAATTNGGRLHPVRLVLKPDLRLDIENRLPWESA